MTAVRNTSEVSVPLMKNLLTCNIKAGVVHLVGFRTLQDGLGGVYRWDATMPTIKHDGRYIIDIRNNADLDAWDASAQTIWNTPVAGAQGCYVMVENLSTLHKPTTVPVVATGDTNALVVPSLRTPIVDGLTFTIITNVLNTDETTLQVGDLSPAPIFTATGKPLPNNYIVPNTMLTVWREQGIWRLSRPAIKNNSAHSAITFYEDGTFIGELKGNGVTITGGAPPSGGMFQAVPVIVPLPASVFSYLIHVGSGLLTGNIPAIVMPDLAYTGTVDTKLLVLPMSPLVGASSLTYRVPIQGYWYNPN